MKFFGLCFIWLFFFCQMLSRAHAGDFEPPVDREKIDAIKRKTNGEELLSLLNINEEPDYPGRRFTSINNAQTHHVLTSNLFKNGFAIYRTPAMDTSRFKTGGQTLVGEPKHIFLGKERISDTGGRLQPELLHEVRTLNDLAGFVKIKNKKDAVEYVRLGSSFFTGEYFSPDIEELFCVAKLSGKTHGNIGTFEECARFGLTTPKVRKSKEFEVEIASDTSRSRFKMKNNPSNKDEGNQDDEDGEKEETEVKSFLVIRNVVIDAENGIFRITEKVGKKGEWGIVDKRLIQPFSEEVRNLIGDRPSASTQNSHPSKKSR